MSAQILIVDDDAGHRTMLKAVLSGWGYAPDEAEDGEVAVHKVGESPYDAVLMDIRMARVGGLEALQRIKKYNPAIPVLIMTAYSSVDTAVKALKSGAYDYLTKPLDFDVLKHTLARMLEHTRLKSENLELKERLGQRKDSRIVGHSKPIRELAETISTVAPSDATVLIQGESGTGKELVAGEIHDRSQRSKGPLVTVNCAALSESLLESELFGHVKGAFTGAERSRNGKFVQADRGTLFLDEIGEIAPSIQAKLLRALQEGEIQKVGSDTTVTVDVRIIAATNRELLDEVAAGRFREDLYYRLNVISITVPPLRDRREDIPLLADHFFHQFNTLNHRELKGFTPQAMDRLLKFSWPGNVRELANAVERAVIMCRGEYITERELPLTIGGQEEEEQEQYHSGQTVTIGGQSLSRLEKIAIMETLEQTGNNKSETARLLGITRATLHNKLKKYGIG
jgi:two-component system response regulator HydG